MAWFVKIFGYHDDEDRTEYLIEEYGPFDTRDEAVAEKRKMFGADGIWTGCDVYARIVRERIIEE